MAGGGGGNLVEVKFRLDDGSDIGPSKFSPATTVTTLKEKIIAQWPREKENGPKIISNVKLINAGKILENHWTLADAILPLGDLPGAVITMHVVVRPPTIDKKSVHLGVCFGMKCPYTDVKEQRIRVRITNIGYYAEKLGSDPSKTPGCSCTIL